MASVIQKQTLTIWCGTIGLATSLVVGCGSSKPPAPPAAPAAGAPAAGQMPMMASAPPGGHGAAPAQAPMHGQAPGGGHGMPMPGAPSSAHAGPGPHGAPSSAHAAGPSSASMTPEQMMANAGQTPASGHGAPGPTSATPGSMPAGHGQGAPGVPGQPNNPATMAAGHGQGAPNTNMPMPLPGGGHNQPGANANAAAMAAAGAAGAGGAHAGNPAAMLAPGGLAPGGLNPGGAGIAGGAGAASQFEPGSAEEALAKFCVAMADSNLTEAAEYISPKAKGLLAQIRDGSLSEEKTDELKESFSPQGLTNLKARQTGVGKAINLSNAKNELLSFTLMRETDDAYFLREFKLSKLPTNMRTPGRSR